MKFKIISIITITNENFVTAPDEDTAKRMVITYLENEFKDNTIQIIEKYSGSYDFSIKIMEADDVKNNIHNKAEGNESS